MDLRKMAQADLAYRIVEGNQVEILKNPFPAFKPNIIVSQETFQKLRKQVHQWVQSRSSQAPPYEKLPGVMVPVNPEETPEVLLEAPRQDTVGVQAPTPVQLNEHEIQTPMKKPEETPEWLNFVNTFGGTNKVKSSQAWEDSKGNLYRTQEEALTADAEHELFPCLENGGHFPIECASDLFSVLEKYPELFIQWLSAKIKK